MLREIIFIFPAIDGTVKTQNYYFIAKLLMMMMDFYGLVVQQGVIKVVVLIFNKVILQKGRATLYIFRILISTKCFQLRGLLMLL